MPSSGMCQGYKKQRTRPTLFLARVISSAPMMEATRPSETSVYNKPTRSHIPEDGVLQLLLSLQLPPVTNAATQRPLAPT
jgi:hypothetical protein